MCSSCNCNYSKAREWFAAQGVDTEEAIAGLEKTPLSIHCWQGDDIMGLEAEAAGASGGIQTTGNYPGRARNAAELLDDIKFAFAMIPGAKRVSIHAKYPLPAEGVKLADRNKLKPEHFAGWVKFAKENGLGLDMNPTFFAHPLAADGLTLSNPNPRIRRFWVDHAIACLKISEYFATELGGTTTMNIWVPDGLKDTPADRMILRDLLKQSLDEIISAKYNKHKVLISLESKVFGIGVESYTVGSAEFYQNYAARNNLLCLLDNGHFHPTEQVADKISSMLLFNECVALHVTRGVRWDSDHTTRYNDELRDIAEEIVRCGPERVLIGLDYFDASINRIAAWVNGARNMQKALLRGFLLPNAKFSALQNARHFTELMVAQDEFAYAPFGDVWSEYCRRQGVEQDGEWFANTQKYEKEVLTKREGKPEGRELFEFERA